VPTKKLPIIVLILCCLAICLVSKLEAKRVTELTFDSAIEIAMNNSYRIKRLQLNIQSTMYRLKAQRAGLKSFVYMTLLTPDINQISDYKWNSTLYKDEIVRQNTRRWQANLSIRQPVILFGYPTNGYVSLNYNVYRYLQKDNGNKDINYYNRLYLEFVQPLFQTNELKYDLEDAELDLEESKLDYISDCVDIIEDVGRDYYNIFRLAYYGEIYRNQLENLLRIQEIAIGHAKQDSSQSMDSIQVQLEIANVRENLFENRSSLRRRLADMKQRLRLPLEDSLYVIPDVKIVPVEANIDVAIQNGYSLNPNIRRMNIRKRKSEIDVKFARARNSFHLNLEATYGLEKQEDRFQSIWERYDNSNSVTLNAYLPIWDWGQRKARIQAEQLDVKQQELNIDEQEENIRKNIINLFTNLNEYQERAVNLKSGLEMANQITELSINKYKNKEITIQDLLQIISKNRETERKFAEVYIGYRRSLMWLMVTTYYNYEKDVSLLDDLKLKEVG